MFYALRKTYGFNEIEIIIKHQRANDSISYRALAEFSKTLNTLLKYPILSTTNCSQTNRFRNWIHTEKSCGINKSIFRKGGSFC